jgi:preprotein translocase subunit SecA
MDELKAATSLASFEQKDPLVVYKMEAYKLFEGLIGRINENTTAYLAKGDLILQDPEDVQEARAPRKPVDQRVSTNRAQAEQAQRRAAEGATPRQKVETFKRDTAKVKRNDICPCGSGKKFKHCHGK